MISGEHGGCASETDVYGYVLLLTIFRIYFEELISEFCPRIPLMITIYSYR